MSKETLVRLVTADLKEKELGLLDTHSAKVKELQSTGQPLAESKEAWAQRRKPRWMVKVLAKICLLPALCKAQREVVRACTKTPH